MHQLSNKSVTMHFVLLYTCFSSFEALRFLTFAALITVAEYVSDQPLFMRDDLRFIRQRAD